MKHRFQFFSRIPPADLAVFASGLALIVALAAAVLQVIFLLAVSGWLPGIQVVRNPTTPLHPFVLQLEPSPPKQSKGQ